MGAGARRQPGARVANGVRPTAHRGCRPAWAACLWSPPAVSADLRGKVVAFLEGRRSSELANLIERHHGVPLAAPCLREVHSPGAPQLQGSIQRVLEAEPD